MSHCHVSAQIDRHAEEQGRITAEEIALEERTEEVIRDLLATPPNKMPPAIRAEVEDFIRDQAWRVAEAGRDA